MSVDKKTLKILNYVYKKHPTIPQMEHFLSRHHLEESFYSSDIFNYIEKRGVNLIGEDEEGYPLAIDESNAYYQTKITGNIEVENNRLITVPYIITSIIVPFVIGVFSSVVTALILMAIK